MYLGWIWVKDLGLESYEPFSPAKRSKKGTMSVQKGPIGPHRAPMLPLSAQATKKLIYCDSSRLDLGLGCRTGLLTTSIINQKVQKGNQEGPKGPNMANMGS